MEVKDEVACGFVKPCFSYMAFEISLFFKLQSLKHPLFFMFYRENEKVVHQLIETCDNRQN